MPCNTKLLQTLKYQTIEKTAKFPKMFFGNYASYARAVGSFIALSIVIIIYCNVNVETAANNDTDTATNTNTRNANSTRTTTTMTRATRTAAEMSVTTWPAAMTTAANSKVTKLLTSKIVVISDKPGHFNKNSLQQQQQQKQEQEHERVISQRGKHELLGKHFDSKYGGQDAVVVAAAAQQLDVNSNLTIDAIAASKGSQSDYSRLSNDVIQPPTTTIARQQHFNNVAGVDDVVGHNGFYDKINISNQRNVFNERQRIATAALATSTTNTTTMVSPATTSLPLLKREAAASSFFKRAAMREAVRLDKQQQSLQQAAAKQQQQQQQHKHELLLHRQKRYLVFPDGSSFQLVFDLIIPIVDYTNFAIMGITCAVAWELPSKPPSEIIENFRDKLAEGTYGLSRRNDTISQGEIKYIDRTSTTTTANAAYNAVYANNYKVPATVAGGQATSGAADERQTTSTYYQRPRPSAAALPDTMLQAQQSQRPYVGAAKDAYYAPATAANPQKHSHAYASTSAAYQAYRPLNYFNANAYKNNNEHNFGFHKEPGQTFGVAGGGDYAHTEYYKNGGGGDGDGGVSSITSGHASTKDKQDSATAANDWWRGAEAYRGGKHKYQYYEDPGWHKDDDWWQRNKQRIEQNWRAKQHLWTQTQSERGNMPQTAAATTNNNIYAYANPTLVGRTARKRVLLQKRPEHRVYPVFGRRRRRERTPPHAFELKLQLLHLREQLLTRQKLYGKIEKLYKAHGHNGTACVLRALCETGQREHQTEPQTFITELLRAIFALPKDISGSISLTDVNMRPRRQHNVEPTSPHQKQQQQLEKVIARHYREARAHVGNCAERFAECEHSIW